MKNVSMSLSNDWCQTVTFCMMILLTKLDTCIPVHHLQWPWMYYFKATLASGSNKSTFDVLIWLIGSFAWLIIALTRSWIYHSTPHPLFKKTTTLLHCIFSKMSKMIYVHPDWPNFKMGFFLDSVKLVLSNCAWMQLCLCSLGAPELITFVLLEGHVCVRNITTTCRVGLFALILLQFN